jgi:hypothetical protein
MKCRSTFTARRPQYVSRHILILPLIEWKRSSPGRSRGRAPHSANTVAMPAPMVIRIRRWCLADIAGIAQTSLANITLQRGSEWPVERPLPKDRITRMKFGMAFVPTTTVGSRVFPKTSIRGPVGPPTLAVSYKCKYVLAPTVEADATHPGWKADR